MKAELGHYQKMLYDLLPPGFYVKTYRVSQAALGSTEWGPYYGVVRCQVRRGSTVPLVVKAIERAGKEYRSKRKADAEADARFTDRVRLDLVGRIDERDASYVLSQVFDPSVSDPLIYFGADQWIREDLGARNNREAVQKFGLAEQILAARTLYQMMEP